MAYQGNFPILCSTLPKENEDPNNCFAGDGPVLQVPDVPTAPTKDVASDVKQDLQEVYKDTTKSLLDQLAATMSDKPLDDKDEWDAAYIKGKSNPMLKLDDTVAPRHQREANKLHSILDKVCFVLCFISQHLSLLTFPSFSTHTA